LAEVCTLNAPYIKLSVTDTVCAVLEGSYVSYNAISLESDA